MAGHQGSWGPSLILPLSHSHTPTVSLSQSLRSTCPTKVRYINPYLGIDLLSRSVWYNSHFDPSTTGPLQARRQMHLLPSSWGFLKEVNVMRSSAGKRLCILCIIDQSCDHWIFLLFQIKTQGSMQHYPEWQDSLASQPGQTVLPDASAFPSVSSSSIQAQVNTIFILL